MIQKTFQKNCFHEAHSQNKILSIKLIICTLYKNVDNINFDLKTTQLIHKRKYIKLSSFMRDSPEHIHAKVHLLILCTQYRIIQSTLLKINGGKISAVAPIR